MSYPNYSFSGDDKDFFMKSSWQVYSNIGGSFQYIGKTSNEKSFSPNTTLTEWWDNSSGTQSLFVLDISKFDFSISFTLMQVVDPNVIPLAWNFSVDSALSGTYDVSGFPLVSGDCPVSGYVRAYQGSQPPVLQSAEWRFVGRSRGGLQIVLVMRNAIVTANGEWKTGAPGEYSGIPVTVRALQDTTQTDKQDDMIYFLIQKEGS